jgi:large subunit ribosomal protein L1
MGKRTDQVKKSYDKAKTYTIAEAVTIIKQNHKTKFDESVDLHIRLGIDPKQTDQTVRGTVMLPHGTGKTKKVAVIAQGEKIKEAEAAGADFVGTADLIEKIQKGWMDFDVLICTPDSMKDLSKLGKLLGPRGLMPNPKSGTVTFELTKTIGELKKGRVQFKNDAYGIVHCPVGKVSFEVDKLKENIKTLVETVTKMKPPSAKGIYMKSIYVSSTMGPGVKIVQETEQ